MRGDTNATRLLDRESEVALLERVLGAASAPARLLERDAQVEALVTAATTAAAGHLSLIHI